MNAAEHRDAAEELLTRQEHGPLQWQILIALTHAVLATIPDTPDPWQVPS